MSFQSAVAKHPIPSLRLNATDKLYIGILNHTILLSAKTLNNILDIIVFSLIYLNIQLF